MRDCEAYGPRLRAIKASSGKIQIVGRREPRRLGIDCRNRRTDLTTLYPAAGCRILAFNPGLNNVGCAADARSYADGTGRAIPGTGSALHASVKITDYSLFALQQKNSVGANVFTHAATHTRLGFKS